MSRFKDIKAELPLDAPPEPPNGGKQLKGHDSRYQAAATTFDQVRDMCNSGIDFINRCLDQVGWDKLPTLPEKSLDDYVVYPLSADYGRIQQNGSACTIFNTGMKTWAGNFETLAVNAVLSFQGKAGVAFSAQMTAYSLVMRAVGGIVSKGTSVYKYLARISEKVAIRVEKCLAELAIRLGRLLTKLSKYARGAVGAGTLVLDFILHGWGVITDIKKDVEFVVNAINKAFDLKDSVEAWAKAQAERVKAFEDVLDSIKTLPTVNLGTGIGDTTAVDTDAIKEDLGDIKPDFGSDGGQEEEDLLSDADGIVDDSGYNDLPADNPNCDPVPPGQNGGGDGRPFGWTPEEGSPGWMITTDTNDDPIR